MLSHILSSNSASSGQTIFEVLSTSKNHSSWIQLLNITSVSFYLSNTSVSSTLFAPTDDSISLLQPPQLFYVELDPWYLHLIAFLSYHIISEVLDAKGGNSDHNVIKCSQADPVNGNRIVSSKMGRFTANR